MRYPICRLNKQELATMKVFMSNSLLTAFVLLGLVACQSCSTSHTGHSADTPEQTASEPEILINITDRTALAVDGISLAEFAQALREQLEVLDQPSPEDITNLKIKIREHTYQVGDIATVSLARDGG